VVDKLGAGTLGTVLLLLLGRERTFCSFSPSASAMFMAAATLADRLVARLDTPTALEPWPLDLGALLSSSFTSGGPPNRKLNAVFLKKLRLHACMRTLLSRPHSARAIIQRRCRRSTQGKSD
jgi:hypothetical protein